MDTHEYDCAYCGKKFKPRRRYVQRFCSTSCRVGSHNRAKKLSKPLEIQELPVGQEQKEKDKIKLTGIAEASIANLATDGLKSFLTKEEDKPLTKKDGRVLMGKLESLEKSVWLANLASGPGQLPKTSQNKENEEYNDFGMDWV